MVECWKEYAECCRNRGGDIADRVPQEAESKMEIIMQEPYRGLFLGVNICSQTHIWYLLETQQEVFKDLSLKSGTRTPIECCF